MLPQILIASETDDFRQMVQRHVTPNDTFLEIGCSFGECTQLLGKLGVNGVAVDHSANAVAQAQQAVSDYAGITVEQVDARDMDRVQRLCPAPSVILLDIGGNESLDKVTSLLRLVLKTFQPRLIMVKSMELAELTALIADFTLPNQPHLLTPFDDSATPQHLLALSRSPVMNDRLFALHRLRRLIDQDDVFQRIKEMSEDASPTVRRQALHALKQRHGAD